MSTPPLRIEADNSDEVAVFLDGSRFRFWQSAQIDLALDSLSTFSLTAPFDPEQPEQREAFRPFGYKPATVYVGGELLFSGTLVQVDPNVSKSGYSVGLGGYSTPGVMGDCEIPPAAYPLEFNGLNLREIAERVAGFFGVSVVFDAEPGDVFDRVAAQSSERALNFLMKLAKERGLIVGNDAAGALRFFKPTIGKPGTLLKQGQPPVVSVAPSYSGQPFFSEVTGFTQSRIARLSEKFTVENPTAGAFRPHTFTPLDVVGVDVQTATRANVGRMFGDAVAVSVNLQGWRNAAGGLWLPGQVHNLQAPGAMIYNETPFMIRAVSLSTDKKSNAASLGLVLPETYTGQIPEVMPWAE